MSSRLLTASRYPFDAANIPVYTNGTFVFSPDVHRLLRVSANIYDASTNRTDRGGPDYPFLPSVFRPIFRVEGSNIFIGGWAEETTNGNWNSVPRDLSDPADLAAVQPNDNIYDVPWIIGVKKGFPNFNEFAMQSVAQITRQLQLRRPSVMSRPNATNQLFSIGISNAFAFEAWNPYPSNYSRAVQIMVANDLTIGFAYTNDPALDPRGSNACLHLTLVSSTNLLPNEWVGYSGIFPNPSNASFVMPLITNIVFLPNSFFRSMPSPGFTTNMNSGVGLFQGFEQSGQFPSPQFYLTVSNRIRFIMVDLDSGRVVDYVTVGGLNGVRNLSAELVTGGGFIGFPHETLFWQTNRPSGNGSLQNPPLGVLNQIETALGNIDVPDWNLYGIGQPSGLSRSKEIDSFRGFMGLSSMNENTNLVQLVPFSPTRKTSQYVRWQANDPAVHHTVSDLTSTLSNSGLIRENPNGQIQLLRNIGGLNDRFEPWGGKPGWPTYGGPLPTVPQYSTAAKDPELHWLGGCSNAANGPLSVAWLGKVHRGTPWQTLYLKSSDVDSYSWSKWLGTWDADAALRAKPLNDHVLFSSLVCLLNTNSPADLLSVNSSDTNAWLQLFEGLNVITNSSSDEELSRSPPFIKFETNTMTASSPQAALMVAGIFQARADSFWRYPGDALSAAEISESSPWLNLSSALQLQSGIADEVYEKVASQLLPKLRMESIGSATPTAADCQLEFTGYDGFPYAIEASNDLSVWTPISTNAPSGGVIRFTDTNVGSSSARFYRSVLLP